MFSRTPPARRVAKSAAPQFEPLEARQLLSVSPVVVGTQVKTQNPFSGNVNIADASKIQVRGYAINPLTGKQSKRVINVLSAAVLSTNHQIVQITTDRLMRKGGKIIFYSGALIDDHGNTLADQVTA